MRSYFLFFMVLLFNTIFAQNEKQEFPELNGPYLGQNPPGKVAEIFAPGILSTELHDDSAPAFSPGGKEVFFRIAFKKNGEYHGKVLHMKEVDGKWTKPKLAEFVKIVDKQMHGGVFYSHDGNRLYNSTSDFIDGKFNLDIALIEKKNDVWSSVRILNSLNSNHGDSYVFETSRGELYWTAEKMRNDPEPNLYKSVISRLGYSKKEQITDFPKTAIVTYISPEKKIALLTWKAKNNNYDLYVSFKDEKGTWGKPINMGPNVNSERTEKHAVLSSDGKYIFFVSSRIGEDTQPQKLWNLNIFNNLEEIWRTDIYWVNADIIEDLRSEYLQSK